jgi:ubiquinone/menaquinone biosynthesis C-methylase UbiE
VSEAELYHNEKSSWYESTFDVMYFKIYDVVTWKYLEPYIPLSSNALILDAGGGTGRWTIRMAKKGCRVILLDISQGMLNIAREKVEKEGLQHCIIIEKGDIRKLKYSDESFDMVFCEHTLFLLNEPDIALKEFARVLKKGAPLVVSAQNLYVQLLMHLPYNEIPMLEKLKKYLTFSCAKNTMHDQKRLSQNIHIDTR